MVAAPELDVGQCAEMARTCACLGFRKASRSVTQFYDRILTPTGLRSTQLDVLLSAYAIGAVNLRTVADQLAMERSTLTRNLRPLIAQRLLRIDAARGRSKTVSVTSQGKRLLLTALPLLQQAQEMVRE